MTKQCDEKTAVLYLDHKGHPSPLSLTYRLASSRHLSSSLCELPLSTITEIDSVYCPNCLDFQTAIAMDEVVTKICASPFCVQCPICVSPLSISTEESVLFYQCEYCRWNSMECDLSVDLDECINTNDGSGRDEFALKQAAELLGSKLKECIDCRGDNLFHLLVESWTVKNQQEQQDKNNETLFGYSIMSHGSKVIDTTTIGGWSISDLEKSLQAKQQNYKIPTSVIDQSKLINNKVFLKLSESKNQEEQLITSQQIQNQGVLYPISPSSNNHLLPIPFQLVSKQIRRCTSKNTSNILVKPNSNPVFGDTSWRGNHGRWWKKEDSAIHIIPKLQMIRHVKRCYNTTTNNVHHFILLKINNPTLGIIRLRLNSRDRGTSDNDNDLSNLLIDPMEKIYVSATLVQSSSSLSFASPIIELQPSSRDTFTRSTEPCLMSEPDRIEDWLSSIPPPNNRDLILSSIPSPNNDDLLNSRLDTITLLHHDRNDDTAYVEIVIVKEENEIDDETTIFLALPLTLEIEVGHGSWELSGIDPITIGDDIDFVPFSILLVWDNI